MFLEETAYKLHTILRIDYDCVLQALKHLAMMFSWLDMPPQHIIAVLLCRGPDTLKLVKGLASQLSLYRLCSPHRKHVGVEKDVWKR